MWLRLMTILPGMVCHKVHTTQHMDSALNCAGYVVLLLVQQELVGLWLASSVHLANCVLQHGQQ